MWLVFIFIINFWFNFYNLILWKKKYEIKFGMTNNYGIELVNKCDFVNQDTLMIETSSLNECGEKCSENEYCTHFSSLEMKCYLKTGIRTEKDAIFGQNHTCGILKSKMVRIFDLIWLNSIINLDLIQLFVIFYFYHLKTIKLVNKGANLLS